MVMVSIFGASRLTGKSRRTIQRHIAAGKLSKVAGGDSIDTSELLRVYGAFKEALTSQSVACDAVATMSQLVAQNVAPEMPSKDYEKEELKAEIDKLKALLETKQETIDSLNKAMLLLEHQDKKSRKKWWVF